MTKTTRNILFIVITITLFALGCFYFAYKFLNAFAPAEITITKTELRNSDGFLNPVTIEKLKVDSLGKEQRPVKYTIEYLTTCDIKQKEGKPPVDLGKIKLTERGRYSWSEENVNIYISHEDGYSSRISSPKRRIWSMGGKRLDICPIKFENENWYFIHYHDPQIVGVYVYINKAGVLHQYMTYTGVSPI